MGIKKVFGFRVYKKVDAMLVRLCATEEYCM